MKKTNPRNVKSKVLLEEDASSHQQLNRPYRIGYFRAAFMYIGSKPMIVFHGGQRSIDPAAVRIVKILTVLWPPLSNLHICLKV